MKKEFHVCIYRWANGWGEHFPSSLDKIEKYTPKNIYKACQEFLKQHPILEEEEWEPITEDLVEKWLKQNEFPYSYEDFRPSQRIAEDPYCKHCGREGEAEYHLTYFKEELHSTMRGDWY